MHPTSGKYEVKALNPYLGDEALLKYMLGVEAAYVQALADLHVCPRDAADNISSHANLEDVTYGEWDLRENNRDNPKYTGHDIRAMVNILGECVPADAKRYIHLALTSEDVKGNATALMIKDATGKVVVPDMVGLGYTLARLSGRYAATPQIGRTHGQHGEPTTFGKEMAVYLDRHGRNILRVKESADALRGKIGGAVGTRASFKLMGIDPYEVERLTLERLGLEPAMATTQILPPEQFTDYYARLITALGTIADLANDMRQLQRTEIAEVAEEFAKGQVGSSTMAHKRNPISFENVCAQFRAVMPHIISVYLNLESEHQRDMRNSGAERYFMPEIINGVDYSMRRLDGLLRRIKVDEAQMMRNLQMTGGKFLSEPAYIALDMAGIPDGHEYMRRLTAVAGKNFSEILAEDELIRDAIARLPEDQQTIFQHPELYRGTADSDAERVAEYWLRRFDEMNEQMR